MKVKIKCWNGVATWLWVANDENCGICRMAFNGCCPDWSSTSVWWREEGPWSQESKGRVCAQPPDLRLRYAWKQLLPRQDVLCVLAPVCPSGPLRLCTSDMWTQHSARCRATTVPWCGASAPTASTCTASSSGSTHSRCSSTAPCAARSGSSRSDAAPLGRDRVDARTGAAFVFHHALTLLSNK
ncbi:anaphase-promoting complex subunit 11 isoform X1 [Lynx rufus]|uniref:anaphase-promoting complex subunit 11 isoform X1 n=1 Tax=Lynx rufus TaxID=61384 RepID=UPI001F124D2D|nr:anaphase-promoting complex subunit 11 isoform X1 [Lynx rufus]XP_046950016.1 anaphase-promoting complex subunit 11 isoform X1 [Lynx rufus]